MKGCNASLNKFFKSITFTSYPRSRGNEEQQNCSEQLNTSNERAPLDLSVSTGAGGRDKFYSETSHLKIKQLYQDQID